MNLSKNNSFNSSKNSAYDQSSFLRKVKTDKKINLKKIYILVGILLALITILYAWGVVYFKDHFLPNTYISGYNMSFMSLDEAVRQLDFISEDRKVVIKGKDFEEAEVLASEVGLVLSDSPNIEETLNEQNPLSWPSNLLYSNATKIESNRSMDEDQLDAVINNLSIVSGVQVIPTENAKAVFNGTEFEIQEETYGTQVNTDVLRGKVHDALFDGTSVINLLSEDCYVMPVVTSDSPELLASLDQLNNALNTTITYDFKIGQETLESAQFANWLTTDDSGNSTFDDDYVNAYIQALKDKYDTVGQPVNFTTSYGEVLEFTSDQGWEIDTEQESTQLKEAILAGTPVVREPVYAQEGLDRASGNMITGTYVEISIGNQEMWFYKDGEVVTDTSVVTGNTNGYSTPTGLYYLQGKGRDVTLKGFNADGSRYESPVTFWMPFNGNIGIHDASWRSSYGGTIYRGNGSHGCINTPYSAAKRIYDTIEVGDPVIVY